MERACHKLAVTIFDTEDNPITPFKEHEVALLESALHNPKAQFGGRDLYPSLTDKAAILYYTLNKNHPFRNGNKRISLCSLLIFLFINKYWLDAGITEIVDMTLKISKSPASDKDKILAEVKEWINKHLIAA